MGVTVYGISPSNMEEHVHLKDSAEIDFDLLSDTSGELGEKLGFVDFEEQIVFRGYAAANLETETLEKEVDYLVGENVEDILSVLEDL